MIIWLTAAAGLGILAAAIAYAKGRPPLLWGLGGTVVGIVVVPYLLLAKDRRDERGWKPERFGLPSRGGNCPHCGARADAEAVVCRVCRKSLISYSPSDTHGSGDSEAGQRERFHPREQRATAAAAKPAASKTERAPHDPLFRRLDEAFARITVEMQRSATERRDDGTDAKPSRDGKDEAEARRQADAERQAEVDRHAEAERQANERWRAAERQAEARRQAEAERQAEVERQAEMRRQAAERQAEARRQAEAERQADAELKAEARRLAAERHAEARRQTEAERNKEDERQAEAEPPELFDEMGPALRAAPTGEGEQDDGREEPRFDSADSLEHVADHEDGWGSPEDERLHMEPRMGRSDPRLAGAWREGRPGFPSLNQGRQRKPWGRRASLALVGVLAALAVLLAPYTGPWLSRLSPPVALNTADIRDVPAAPAGDPTNEWETASGASDEAHDDADPASPSSARISGSDSAKTPAGPASQGDRPTDGADTRPGKETATAALTPPPKNPPSPAAAARPAPLVPEKRAAVSDPARSGRNVERPVPRREPVEAPLAEDFATAVRKALSEHRGQSPVLGAMEASGITAAGEIVTLVQQRLRERGYDPGSVDGRAGPRTRAAIRKFQRDNNQEEDGDVSVALLQSLGILGQQIHAFGGEVAPTRSP